MRKWPQNDNKTTELAGDFTECLLFISDIEAQIADIQSKKKELAASQAAEKGVGLLESGYFDTELYDEGADKTKRYEGYVTSIAPNDDVDDDDDDGLPVTKRSQYTAPKSILKDVIKQVNIISHFWCTQRLRCACSTSIIHHVLVNY